MGIEIIIPAAAAIFVLVRLYSVLGKQKGAPPPSFGQQSQKSEKPHPVLVHSDNDDRFDEEDESSGFEQIARADPNFTQREFDRKTPHLRHLWRNMQPAYLIKFFYKSFDNQFFINVSNYSRKIFCI